jgi:hypothetical protein
MDKGAEVAVRGTAANNSHLSTRQTENFSGISKKMWTAFLKFHPHHVSLHQELHGNDFINGRSSNFTDEATRKTHQIRYKWK